MSFVICLLSLSELIQHFGIDWKLLLAQAINFFVLLFILRKFAYQPIFAMLNKRRREIEKGLEYTQKAEAELHRIDEKREETLKEARGEALVIVTEAEAIAKNKKEEIVADANRKVEGIVADAKRAIEEQKAKLGEEAYRNAQDLVRTGIEKVLGKMPAGERDKHLIQEALGELKNIKNT